MDMISGLRDAAAKQKPEVTLDPELAAAFSLDGRTAVVTGAAMGIGRQTAITYAKAGARVVLADRAKEGLDETASMIDGAVVVPTDVSVRSEVDDLARAAIKQTGRVDVWANVAGIIRNFTVVDAVEEDVDAIIAVNLKGVYWGCAAAGRIMSTAKRGAIVNVASAGGEMAAPTLSAYGMTKAAVVHLTKTVAAELGPNGIRCNAVAPGFVETPMTSRNWTNPDGTVDEEKRQAAMGGMATMAPLRTTGDTTDIAYAMLYLAADASRFVTGQVVRPNGGVVM